MVAIQGRFKIPLQEMLYSVQGHYGKFLFCLFIYLFLELEPTKSKRNDLGQAQTKITVEAVTIGQNSSGVGGTEGKKTLLCTSVYDRLFIYGKFKTFKYALNIQLWKN